MTNIWLKIQKNGLIKCVNNKIKIIIIFLLLKNNYTQIPLQKPFSHWHITKNSVYNGFLEANGRNFTFWCI